MKYLKELCLLNGTSGNEENVRDFIISHLGNNEYTVDNLGNIIVEKKGKKTPQNKIMLSAHMDEVGFIITYISENGQLKFDTVGGIDSKAILGKTVIINSETKGVIGTNPVHLCTKEQENKMPEKSEMYIDIGAENREQAEKYVSLGDFAYFESDYVELANGFIKSKAIDDRFGCAVLLNMLEKESEYNISVCFVVQEEIGLKGAEVVANRVNPDIAIVIEGTTANDTASVSGSERVCVLGDGAVVSFMDGRTLYDSGLYNLAMETAKDVGVNVQTKTKIAGGNDAGAIQKAGTGAKVCAVSLPTRYIHSASSVAKMSDAVSIEKLVANLVNKFGELEK